MGRGKGCLNKKNKKDWCVTALRLSPELKEDILKYKKENAPTTTFSVVCVNMIMLFLKKQERVNKDLKLLKIMDNKVE